MPTSSRSENKWRILSFLPLLLMMCLIWSFSAQEAEESAGLSMRFGLTFVRAFDRVLQRQSPEAELEQYAEALQFFVRKAAHVTEYALLGFAAALPVRVYRVRKRYVFVAAALFCVAFAGLDEWHQTFVAGRDGSVRDVLIDCIGIVPAVWLSAHTFTRR